MDGRKDTLLLILSRLEPHRPLASVLRTFVQSEYCKEVDLNRIVEYLSVHIREFKKTKQIEKKQKQQLISAQANIKQEDDIREAENLLKGLGAEFLEQNNSLDVADEIAIKNKDDLLKTVVEFDRDMNKREEFGMQLEKDPASLELIYGLLKTTHDVILRKYSYEQMRNPQQFFKPEQLGEVQQDKTLLLAFWNLFPSGTKDVKPGDVGSTVYYHVDMDKFNQERSELLFDGLFGSLFEKQQSNEINNLEYNLNLLIPINTVVPNRTTLQKVIQERGFIQMQDLGDIFGARLCSELPPMHQYSLMGQMNVLCSYMNHLFGKEWTRSLPLSLDDQVMIFSKNTSIAEVIGKIETELVFYELHEACSFRVDDLLTGKTSLENMYQSVISKHAGFHTEFRRTYMKDRTLQSLILKLKNEKRLGDVMKLNPDHPLLNELLHEQQRKGLDTWKQEVLMMYIQSNKDKLFSVYPDKNKNNRDKNQLMRKSIDIQKQYEKYAKDIVDRGVSFNDNILSEGTIQMIKDWGLYGADMAKIQGLMKLMDEKESLFKALYDAKEDLRSDDEDYKEEMQRIGLTPTQTDRSNPVMTTSNLLDQSYGLQIHAKIQQINELYLDALSTVDIGQFQGERRKPYLDANEGTYSATIPLTGQRVNMNNFQFGKQVNYDNVLVDTNMEELQLGCQNFSKAFREKRWGLVCSQGGSLLVGAAAAALSAIVTKNSWATAAAMALGNKIGSFGGAFGGTLLEDGKTFDDARNFAIKQGGFEKDPSGNINYAKGVSDFAFDVLTSRLTLGLGNKLGGFVDDAVEAVIGGGSRMLALQLAGRYGGGLIKYGMKEVFIEEMFINSLIAPLQTATYSYLGWNQVDNGRFKPDMTIKTAEGDIWGSIQQGMEARDNHRSLENLANTTLNCFAYGGMMEGASKGVSGIVSAVGIYNEYSAMDGVKQSYLTKLNSYQVTLKQNGINIKEEGGVAHFERNGRALSSEEMQEMGLEVIAKELIALKNQFFQIISNLKSQISGSEKASFLVSMFYKYGLNKTLVSPDKALDQDIELLKKRLEDSTLSNQDRTFLEQTLQELELTKKTLVEGVDREEGGGGGGQGEEEKEERQQNSQNNIKENNSGTDVLETLSLEQTEEQLDKASIELDNLSLDLDNPSFVIKINNLIVQGLNMVGIKPELLLKLLGVLEKIHTRNANRCKDYLSIDVFTRLMSLLQSAAKNVIMSAASIAFVSRITSDYIKSNKGMTLDHKIGICDFPTKTDGTDLYVDESGSRLSQENAINAVKEHDNFIGRLFGGLGAALGYAVKTTFHLTDERTLPGDKDVAMNVETSKKLVDKLLGDPSLGGEINDLTFVDKFTGEVIPIDISSRDKLYDLADVGNLKIVFKVKKLGVELEHEYFAENGGGEFDVFNEDGKHNGDPKIVGTTAYIGYDVALTYTLAVLKYEMKLLGEGKDEKGKLSKRIINLMQLIQNGDKDANKKLNTTMSALWMLITNLFDRTKSAGSKSKDEFEKCKKLLREKTGLDEDIINSLPLPGSTTDTKPFMELGSTATIGDLQNRIYQAKTPEKKSRLQVELDGILASYNFSTREGWGYMVQLQLLRKFLGKVDGDAKKGDVEVNSELQSDSESASIISQTILSELGIGKDSFIDSCLSIDGILKYVSTVELQELYALNKNLPKQLQVTVEHIKQYVNHNNRMSDKGRKSTERSDFINLVTGNYNPQTGKITLYRFIDQDAASVYLKNQAITSRAVDVFGNGDIDTTIKFYEELGGGKVSEELKGVLIEKRDLLRVQHASLLKEEQTSILALELVALSKNIDELNQMILGNVPSHLQSYFQKKAQRMNKVKNKEDFFHEVLEEFNGGTPPDPLDMMSYDVIHRTTDKSGLGIGNRGYRIAAEMHINEAFPTGRMMNNQFEGSLDFNELERTSFGAHYPIKDNIIIMTNLQTNSEVRLGN